jgi:FeS assembly protein IscX
MRDRPIVNQDEMLELWQRILTTSLRYAQDERFQFPFVLSVTHRVKSKHERRSIQMIKDYDMKLYWNSPEDIAEQLLETHPEVDPLSVRFTDLHRWVMELDGFADDPKASSEGKLEKIQMTWLELYKEQNE